MCYVPSLLTLHINILDTNLEFSNRKFNRKVPQKRKYILPGPKMITYTHIHIQTLGIVIWKN